MRFSKFELRRQLFHIIGGILLVMLLFFDIINVYILMIFFVIGFIISIASRRYKVPVVSWFLGKFDREEKIPGRGALFYLLGAVIVLLSFEKDVALAAIMVLVLGDSLSHLGQFGKIKHPFNDKKFLEGMFIGTLGGFIGAVFFVNWVAALVGSLAAMIAEGFDFKQVDDNLIVPVVAGIVIRLVQVFFL